MRQIKFRGLRVDGKGWVYGVPFYIHGERKCFIIDNCQSGNLTQEDSVFQGKEVEYESVCQFTGLKDKNGNDIYEGDVIQLTREEEYGELIYITDNKYTYETAPIPNRIFETLTFMDFIYTVMYSEAHGGLWGRSPEHIEVIGTIHDGKEVANAAR